MKNNLNDFKCASSFLLNLDLDVRELRACDFISLDIKLNVKIANQQRNCTSKNN